MLDIFDNLFVQFGERESSRRSEWQLISFSYSHSLSIPEVILFESFTRQNEMKASPNSNLSLPII